jgi:hypothetical protein
MARDESPPITARWRDGELPDDDDLIVTRESLDAVASSPAPWEGHIWLLHGDGRDETNGQRNSGASADGEGASGPTFPATGALMRIVWSHSLTFRQKALRTGGMLLLVLLAVYLVIGGPAATPGVLSSAGDALNARLHPPKPQPTLAERGYSFIKSPPGSYNLPEISIAPVADHANGAWACWSSPFSASGPRGVWRAEAFYTDSNGAHWSRLQLPQSAALECSALADGENSANALVALGQGLAPDGSCIAPFLYLTTDTGASWTQVSWPSGPSEAACQYSAALEGGAIYLWAPTPLLRGTSLYTPPTGRLIVSRDGGQTWALADNGLNDVTGLDIIGFRPGGAILADIADVHGNGSSSLLMASDDFGASWRSLGDLPGAFPQVFVSSDHHASAPAGWGRLYVLSRTVINNSPSVPPTYALSTGFVGGKWADVPLPPLVAGQSAIANANQPLVIGVGPAGSLEVERGIVESRNAQLSPARLLWVWDPIHSQWLEDPQGIPGNLALEGSSWRAGDQIIWVTTLQLGVPPVLQIYTKTYPADLLAHIQSGQGTS